MSKHFRYLVVNLETLHTQRFHTRAEVSEAIGRKIVPFGLMWLEPFYTYDYLVIPRRTNPNVPPIPPGRKQVHAILLWALRIDT